MAMGSVRCNACIFYMRKFEHESLEVIREAVQIVRESRPDIKIDGEFQLTSAIIPQVAERKVKMGK